jgi:hypothetical protein
MQQRTVFSSPAMFFNKMGEYPKMAEISAFASLKSAADQYNAPSSGCACKKNGLLRSYKGLYEAALSSLQDSDKANLKGILGVQEICYYRQNEQNVLELICF